MTREEKTKAIAEWLSPHRPACRPRMCAICQRFYNMDFFTDEVANALVLEKMLEVFHVAIMRKDYVRFEPTLGRYYEGIGDRKTAICEAALAFTGLA